MQEIEILANDWLKKEMISIRLHKYLVMYSKDYPDCKSFLDIDEQIFIRYRGVGVTTFKEFIKFKSNY